MKESVASILYTDICNLQLTNSYKILYVLRASTIMPTLGTGKSTIQTFGTRFLIRFPGHPIGVSRETAARMERITNILLGLKQESADQARKKFANIYRGRTEQPCKSPTKIGDVVNIAEKTYSDCLKPERHQVLEKFSRNCKVCI